MCVDSVGEFSRLEAQVSIFYITNIIKMCICKHKCSPPSPSLTIIQINKKSWIINPKAMEYMNLIFQIFELIRKVSWCRIPAVVETET